MRSEIVADLTEIRPSIQLKGGLFTLTTLQILTADLQCLEEQIDSKIAQAPNFFNNAPIVIDLINFNKQDLTEELDLVALYNMLIAKKLVPVGVKNADPNQQKQAIQAKLAILRSKDNFENHNKYVSSSNVTATRSATNSENTINNPVPVNSIKNKLIIDPVRSGQQIYVPEGDLTIVGPVNNGAELLAEGNIHIYGALRGRALAGINGNTNSRIFCNSLEADLVSIAGQFKISENIDPKFWRRSVQIFLANGRLEISEIL